MRVDNIAWSVVSGTHNGKLFIIFRSDGFRKDAGKVAKQSFGRIGSAGGHKSMARAEIAVSELKERVEYKDDRKLLNWIMKQINTRSGKTKKED